MPMVEIDDILYEGAMALLAGLLMSNPIGLGIVGIAGIGYGIARIAYGDEVDVWINENFGYNNP